MWGQAVPDEGWVSFLDRGRGKDSHDGDTTGEITGGYPYIAKQLDGSTHVTRTSVAHENVKD